MWFNRNRNRNRNTVNIEINGVEIKANKKRSILSSCLSNNIDIKHNCGAGKCGKCRIFLVSGEVKTINECSKQMLACSSYPSSDLVIKTF